MGDELCSAAGEVGSGGGGVRGFGDRQRSWSSAVVQVLDGTGDVAGAGFLADEGVVVTCAHLVQTAGYGPGDEVKVRFPHLPSAPVVSGVVLAEAWRAPEAEDVAALRMANVPVSARPLALGAARGSKGHPVSTFGFPTQAPEFGHFGGGTAVDMLPTARMGTQLQLTCANDLTTGFSGGPVVDDMTGLVIGMVTAITAPDPYGRGQGIAYATPAEVLREVVPGLVEQRICPYPGLEPFIAQEAGWFHGRDAAVGSVLEALRRHRLVLLLGPSGAGKSSLVQAGVLHALSEGRLPGSDRWEHVVARPGRNLAAELERSGLPGAGAVGIRNAVEGRLAAGPGGEHLLLVIDQFEELLARPRADVRRIADDLLAVVDGCPNASVVLIMRNDFFSRLAEVCSRLLEAATPGSVNVPAQLTASELHAIITRPAVDAGARFEDGLAEGIVDDLRAVDPDGGTPATLLPPLQLVLVQLWERRTDGRLTHQAYRRIGRVSGSLTDWCNSVVGRLPAGHRSTARRLLTALVRPADDGRGIPAARQQVPLARLRALAVDATSAGTVQAVIFDEVVAALSRDRIITTGTVPRPDGEPGEPIAELIHDALIRDWGDLREWVTRDRWFQAWLHRVTEQRDRHTRTGLAADLLDGTDLAEGMDWSGQRSLPTEITDFLTASERHQQAAVRRTRRLNNILVGLLALALVAVGLAVWQRQEAVAAESEAQSRQLAAQSEALTDIEPELASLLAVHAYRTSPTEEARASLLQAADLGLTSLLTGHLDDVDALAFGPDGRTLISGSGDGAVRTWDIASGRQRGRPFVGRGGPPAGGLPLALSPDGRTLALDASAPGSDDFAVRLWDVASGEQRGELLTGEDGPVMSLAFSPDGKTVASGDFNDTVRLWDVASGKPLRGPLGGHGSWVTSLVFSPDGRTLASYGTDFVVRLWDVASGEQRRKLVAGKADSLMSLTFSPDGRTLAGCGGNGKVRLWDVASGEQRSELLTGEDDLLVSVAFGPDGRKLAAGDSDGVVRLWDVDEVERRRELLTGQAGAVASLRFGPDGRTLAAGSEDGTVRLWNLAFGRQLEELRAGEGGSVVSVFGPDGRALAVGSEDGTVRLWYPASGIQPETLRSGEGDPVVSMAFRPDGRSLAVAWADGTVRLQDRVTGRLRSVPLAGLKGEVVSLVFSPDGRSVAVGSDDGTVRLWDAASGRLLETLSMGKRDLVLSLAFSPDGRTLAAGRGERTDFRSSAARSGDGVVRLWDVASGRQRGDLLMGDDDLVASLAFSPDGRTLAAGSEDGTVRLWEAASWAQRNELPTGTDELVASLAFSPDGRSLAARSNDSAATLWDLDSGQQRRVPLTSRTNEVVSLAFSPDGRTVASGDGNGAVRLWDMALPDTTAAIEQICHALHRDFTQEERSQYVRGTRSDPVCPDAK
ncbi:trypsin-like peptidase domain-containing protein [Streptomyces sp. NPDC058869]|uniref:nSTAND1 domain-containing NTPase n=1 Tax=Streptomyces sp. NPDC058869 TaxID=3346659 RepID=UPI0036B19C56